MQLRLADGIVDVELDREHYDVAIDKALAIYRQLSSGSVEESFFASNTKDGVTEYTLPDEVQEVRRIYSRGIGTNSGGGTNFDLLTLYPQYVYVTSRTNRWTCCI